jgi:hypothetical protein
MATRSLIGMMEADQVRFIYCHWDGYPSHNGALLLDHHSTVERVRGLLDLGDLSSLGEELGEKHDFDWRMKLMQELRAKGVQNYDEDAEYRRLDRMCLAYGRDRGETDIEAKTCSREQYRGFAVSGEYGAEYVYLAEPRLDGSVKWLVANHGGVLVELTRRIVESDEIHLPVEGPNAGVWA